MDPKERARLVSELTATVVCATSSISSARAIGPRHRRHRELAARDGRRRPPAVLRRHDHGHHAAQGRRACAVQREGARSSHVAVDRRRRRHDGRARQHRVSEPRRRAADRLGSARGARLADRDRSSCSTDETTGEAVANPVSRCLQEGRVVTLADNVVLVARDGSTIAIQDSAAPIQDRNGQIVGAVMVFHDVRQERQLHRRLAYLASHDPLTGFINRREFEERLSIVLAAAEGGAQQDGGAALHGPRPVQGRQRHLRPQCRRSAAAPARRRAARAGAEERRARAARRRRVRGAAAGLHAACGRGYRRVAARGDRGVPLLVARQRAAGRRQHRHRARSRPTARAWRRS